MEFFDDLPLASGTVDALDLAAERAGGGTIGSFEILAATIAVDAIGRWGVVQLRASFIEPGEAARFPDPDPSPDGKWKGVALTASAREGLEDAAEIARAYDLMPLPPGALVLGLVRRPDSGAARALLCEAELGHSQLLRLLQDELLDTTLEGLTGKAAPKAPPRTEAAPRAEAAQTEPGRLGAPVDATTRAGAGRPRVPPPGPSTLPRDDPALRELLAGAEPLREPAAAGGPWLFSRGDRELTLHDLRELSASRQRRVKAEASIPLSLGDVPDVVPALAVELRDGWLAVETRQLGESLAQHLAAVADLTERRLTAEGYAERLAAVAAALQAVHDRGLVHGDVEPASLRVDLDSGRLEVTGFALAGIEDDAVSDRYRAPEWFNGEVGPSIDQYALGVTARDAFEAPGAPPLTGPVQAVLRRATASRPEDRFPSVAAFGTALEAAVGDEAPRGLAERVAARSPAVRAALTPTAIAALVTIAGATALAPGSVESTELSFLTSLLLLALVAGFTFVTVALAGLIRGRRTFASLPFASRPWVPFVAFLLFFAGGFTALDDSDLGAVVFRSLVFAYGGCALLAPARPDAASWLVRALGVWDRRHRWSARRRRAASLGLATATVALLTAPAIANLFWDNYEYPTISAREFSPMTAVWNFRIALDHSDYGFFCERVLAPPASRPGTRCRKLARLAAAVQSADPATSRSPESFGMSGTMDSFRVQQIPTAPGLGAWELLTPSGRLAGSLYTAGDDSHLVAMLSRTKPQPRPTRPRSLWLYELSWQGGEWRVTGYRACELPPPGSGKRPARCAITSSATDSELERIQSVVDLGDGDGR